MLTTTEEVINEEIGNISEIDIISGEKLQRSEMMTAFLLDVLQMFGNTKKLTTHTRISYIASMSPRKREGPVYETTGGAQWWKTWDWEPDEEYKLGVWSRFIKVLHNTKRTLTTKSARQWNESLNWKSRSDAQIWSPIWTAIFIWVRLGRRVTTAQIEKRNAHWIYGRGCRYEEMGMDGTKCIKR